MSEVRLIDANAYAAEMKERQDALKEMIDAAVKDDNWELYDKLSRSFGVFVEAKLTLDNMPTVDAVPREWWDELESTVSKLVEDNDNFPENKQFYDCARFLLNLMGVIERRNDGRV